MGDATGLTPGQDLNGSAEGDAVGVDRIELHATVMDSAGGTVPGEAEAGLQFLIADERLQFGVRKREYPSRR